MTDDRHSPTSAGPEPEPPPTATASGAVVAPPPQGPTGGEAAGELPFGIPPDRPEILVGAAFAGGLLAAIILKRLGGR
jgi:hypothetical protein